MTLSIDPVEHALYARRFSDQSLASALLRRDVRITAWVLANWHRCAVARAIAEHAVGRALAKAGR